MKRFALFLMLMAVCGSAPAQDLTILYESPPGTRPASVFTDGFESGDLTRFDANGDGTPELLLTKEDEQGRITDLVVVGFARLDTLAVVPDVQGLLTDDGTLVLLFGFCDCDADGRREMVFANDNEVALIDPDDPQSLDWSSSTDLGLASRLRLFAVTDLNDDGAEEIIVGRLDTRQVIIFGVK